MDGWPHPGPRSNRVSPNARLNRAIHKARAMITRAAGEPPAAARLRIERASEFAASISLSRGQIGISTGVLDRLDELWSLLWPTDLLTGARGGRSAADHADFSLTWLFLHELTHVRLEHHRLLNNTCLIEVGPPAAPRLTPTAVLRAFLDGEDRSRVSRCLELQADDDATRAFLSGYSEGGDEAYRARAVSIFVVMVLIERENARLGNRNITHPAAATRLFMLMATMMTIWGDADANRDIRDDGHVYLPADALPTDRFDVYKETVLRPLLDDVRLVVAAAGAVSFSADLDHEGALFRDLQTALFDSALSPARFLTQAAREWLDLAPLNLKILRFLGHL